MRLIKIFSFSTAAGILLVLVTAPGFTASSYPPLVSPAGTVERESVEKAVKGPGKPSGRRPASVGIVIPVAPGGHSAGEAPPVVESKPSGEGVPVRLAR